MLIISYEIKQFMFLIFIETIILSVVQGITEFLPVSSSAHLIIFSKLGNFQADSLTIDIGAHLGSLIAILIFFRKDLLKFSQNKSLYKLIFLGSIPLVLFGFYFYSSGIIYILRDIKVIAWTTLIFGLLLFLADRSKSINSIDQNINYKTIIIIGLFQVLALIPGVSRAGIIITAARFLNFKRYDATKISFLLSIPALLGASIINVNDIIDLNEEQIIYFLFSVLFSFIFSYLTIKYFLKFISMFSMTPFVVYRIFLSLLLFILIFF